MRMQNRQFFSFVLLFLMIFFLSWGCGEKEKPAKAPVVSKKIAVKSEVQAPKEDETAKTEASAKKTEKGIVGQEVQATTRIYDPKQRIGPVHAGFRGEKTRYRIE